MAVGAIPWSATRQWAESEGVIDDERFSRLIRALDNEFLAAAAEDDD